MMENPFKKIKNVLNTLIAMIIAIATEGEMDASVFAWI